MRTIKRFAAVTLIFAIVLSFTACGPDDSKNAKTEYTWDSYTFTVHSITEKDMGDSKIVTVKLVIQDKGMPVDFFESQLNDGKMLFNGKEPEVQYQYRANGSGNLIVVEVNYIVASSYVLNESDLVIKE